MKFDLPNQKQDVNLAWCVALHPVSVMDAICVHFFDTFAN